MTAVSISGWHLFLGLAVLLACMWVVARAILGGAMR